MTVPFSQTVLICELFRVPPRGPSFSPAGSLQSIANVLPNLQNDFESFGGTTRYPCSTLDDATYVVRVVDSYWDQAFQRRCCFSPFGSAFEE
jgi:hypothetical protein